MKTYLPSDFINSNYKYRINGDYYVVIKDTNCYQQYSSTYCDCVNVYPKFDYISSEVYSCSLSNSSNYLSSNYFTSDFYYRIDLSSILIIFLIFAIFIVYLPYRIMSRVFGRWLKI